MQNRLPSGRRAASSRARRTNVPTLLPGPSWVTTHPWTLCMQGSPRAWSTCWPLPPPPRSPSRRNQLRLLWCVQLFLGRGGDHQQDRDKTRQLESLQLTRSVCLTSIEGKINSKEKKSIRLNRTHGLKNRTKLVCPTIHVFHCRLA